MLKPGAHVIVGAPNAASLMKRVDLAIRGRHPYAHFEDWMRSPYFEHYREYTANEYREILLRSGFQVTQQLMSSAVPRARARSRRSCVRSISWGGASHAVSKYSGGGGYASIRAS